MPVRHRASCVFVTLCKFCRFEEVEQSGLRERISVRFPHRSSSLFYIIRSKMRLAVTLAVALFSLVVAGAADLELDMRDPLAYPNMLSAPIGMYK